MATIRLTMAQALVRYLAAQRTECDDRTVSLFGGTAPAVLSAANEVAVAAFLEGRIPFMKIPEVIESTLAALPGGAVRHFEDLFDVDEAAREHARGLIEGLAVA